MLPWMNEWKGVMEAGQMEIQAAIARQERSQQQMKENLKAEIKSNQLGIKNAVKEESEAVWKDTMAWENVLKNQAPVLNKQIDEKVSQET